MEERREFGQEIVEVYRQPDPRERVWVYHRPLPGRKPPADEMPVPRRGRHRKGLVIFLVCFVAAVALAAAAVILTGGDTSADRTDGEDWEAEPITIPDYPFGQGVTLPVERAHGEALTAQEVYRRVNPAVVTVMTELSRGMSVGAGVIFTADGYVLTNYHVLSGGSDCLVATAAGYTYSARYVAGDADNDLAVLKIDTEELDAFVAVFPCAEFGDSDLLTVGDPVYAIGNPLGVELRGTLTDGIVSAINRDVWVDGRTMTLIQTNAALNSGNSGGPLINEYGQVVGINTIKMTSSGSNVEGLGFAIPTAYLQRIVNDLLTWGALQPEPVLGLTVFSPAEQVSEGVLGLLVQSVAPGGSAERAGIQAGDYVLTADGQSLTTIQDLLRIRRQHYLGETLPLTVWRDGAILEVTLELDQTETEEVLPEDLN